MSCSPTDIHFKLKFIWFITSYITKYRQLETDNVGDKDAQNETLYKFGLYKFGLLINTHTHISYNNKYLLSIITKHFVDAFPSRHMQRF